MTLGRQGGAVIQETRPGAGFEAGDFAWEKLEGLPCRKRRSNF